MNTPLQPRPFGCMRTHRLDASCCQCNVPIEGIAHVQLDQEGEDTPFEYCDRHCPNCNSKELLQ